MKKSPSQTKQSVQADDIIDTIKRLSELRDVKKDVVDYTDEHTYFSRAFHRCFELGPFIAGSYVDGVGNPALGTGFLSSSETGPVATITEDRSKFSLLLQRFIVSGNKLVESAGRPKPGDVVVWKVYFNNLDYPSVKMGSNMSVPEIIAAWGKFTPMFAKLLDTESQNVDTIIHTIEELKNYLAPDMMSDYATGGMRPGDPGC